jgi:hypothetical protein
MKDCVDVFSPPRWRNGAIFTWENVHNLDPLLFDEVFQELPVTELCERNPFSNLNVSILIF